MLTIYIASENLHKIDEFKKLLDPVGCRVEGIPKDIPSAVENGRTFMENARAKAQHYARYVSGYILADDSGIVVHALNGEPGIYSARYAGIHGDDTANNRKLLEKLKGIAGTERTADFVCAICLYDSQAGSEFVVEGKVHGLVLAAPRGMDGFGYDPLFYVPELERTFAELTMDDKNTFSHRARAVQALIQVWKEKERRHADLRSE